MAVRLYDEAIVKKIQGWVTDPSLRVLKPDETNRLFQMIADMNDDKIKLPLISIARLPNITLSIPTKRPLTFNGVKISKFTGEQIPDKTKVMQLDAIPIQIAYQIDIYTRFYEDADEYVRNIVYNFVNSPKMIVDIPYNNANIQHVCYARVQNEITDNSDVPNKLFPDQFTRWSFTVRIDDAYLFSVPVKDGARIASAKLGTIETNDNKVVQSSIVLTDDEEINNSEEIVDSSNNN